MCQNGFDRQKKVINRQKANSFEIGSMENKKMEQIKNRKSLNFTLIELLVVIAIIGILASMLLPALSKAREVAKKSKCISQIKSISNGAILYANDYNNYLPAEMQASPFTNYPSGWWAMTFRMIGGQLDVNYAAPYKTMNKIYDCPSSNHSGFEASSGFLTYGPTLTLLNSTDVAPATNACGVTVMSRRGQQGGWTLAWNNGRTTAKKMDKIPPDGAILTEKVLSATGVVAMPGNNTRASDMRPTVCFTAGELYNSAAWSHTGSANFLFNDGHVTNYKGGAWFNTNTFAPTPASAYWTP